MNKVQIKNNGELIYSPFTGNPASDEDGNISENDSSLLYVYYGMAGYAYISDKLTKMLDEEIEDLSMNDLASKLEDYEGVIFEVDTNYNGLNSYGFVEANK